MEIDHRKTEFLYRVFEDRAELATLTLIPTGCNLFVHNIVNVWSREKYRLYLAAFEIINRDMRARGYRLLITGSSCNEQQPKRERYWRMMGFSIFTDTEVDGHKLRAAVLDLEA